jgi:hypothetical protein
LTQTNDIKINGFNFNSFNKFINVPYFFYFI